MFIFLQRKQKPLKASFSYSEFEALIPPTTASVRSFFASTIVLYLGNSAGNGRVLTESGEYYTRQSQAPFCFMLAMPSMLSENSRRKQFPSVLIHGDHFTRTYHDTDRKEHQGLGGLGQCHFCVLIIAPAFCLTLRLSSILTLPAQHSL